MKKKHLAPLFLLYSFCSWAQDSLHTSLKELIIVDQQTKQFSQSQRDIQLNDTLIKRSSATFTDVLLFNSSIYFKENGSGMVSSPSFRGTTAQQTAVLWNGLKVNSMFLGQTDFNAIAFKAYDQIVLKPGGGSVLMGTSAIGGSILLNNDVRWYPHFTNEVQAAYGSFNTFRANYNVSAGTERWNVQANINHNESDNDFEVKNRTWKNTNGAYANNSINTVAAYKWNAVHQLIYMGHFYTDDRHFSLVSPNEIRTKYTNETSRNLLQWKAKTEGVNSQLRLGYVTEQYAFYEQLPTNNQSGGEVKTWSAQYALDLTWQPKTIISGVVDYENSAATGQKTGITQAHQEVFSARLLAKHQINSSLGVEIGLKQEITAAYNPPLLYSAGMYWSPSASYDLKINASKNYRVPTFNDLYWAPGGNLSLRPETSYQLDVAQEFKTHHLVVSANVYGISIQDMIRWLPTAAGYWEATNTDKVEIFGAELRSALQWKWQNHSLQLQGGYAYTQSRNAATKKQLIYVPLHKINGSLQYSFHSFSLLVQGIINGKVYTLSDNDHASAIESYGLVNTQLGYTFGKKKQHFVAFEIKNTADTVYENIENRPMPGRNYMVQLITKF